MDARGEQVRSVAQERRGGGTKPELEKIKNTKNGDQANSSVQSTRYYTEQQQCYVCYTRRDIKNRKAPMLLARQVGKQANQRKRHGQDIGNRREEGKLTNTMCITASSPSSFPEDGFLQSRDGDIGGVPGIEPSSVSSSCCCCCCCWAAGSGAIFLFKGLTKSSMPWSEREKARTGERSNI